MDLIVVFIIYWIYAIISLFILLASIIVEKLRRFSLIFGILSIGNYLFYVVIGERDALKVMKALYNYELYHK